MHAFLSIQTQVQYMYVCVCVCMHVRIHVFMHVCMYLFMYFYILNNPKAYIVFSHAICKVITISVNSVLRNKLEFLFLRFILIKGDISLKVTTSDP